MFAGPAGAELQPVSILFWLAGSSLFWTPYPMQLLWRVAVRFRARCRIDRDNVDIKSRVLTVSYGKIE